MAANHQYAGIAIWNFKPEAAINSFADAEAFVGSRKGEVKLAASMTIRFQKVQQKRAYIIRLYSTDIICYFEDGTFWADNGGHNTPTTSRRINVFTPKGWFFFHERKLLKAWSPSGDKVIMDRNHQYFAQ